MGALMPLAAISRQPQQGTPINLSTRIGAGALAVITPTLGINWVTGKPLSRSGTGYSLATLGGYQTVNFRKNFYLETEMLPALGTRSYIAFWLGYPIATGTAGNGTEPAFVLGSSTNSVGICTSTGTNRTISVGPGGTNNSMYWGGVNASWATVYGSSDGIPNIGSTSGKPVMLMMVRNQNSLDFWRDGVMVKSLPVGISSIAAFKLIAGAFVEDPNWYVSANMALSGLIALSSDPSPAELQAFATNPWGVLFNSTAGTSTLMALMAGALAGSTLGAALEAVSGADLTSAAYFSSAQVAEILSTADSASATATNLASRAESGTASDTVSSILTLVSSQSESAVLADAASALQQAVASAVESGTAVEISTASSTGVTSWLDALGATDVVSAGAINAATGSDSVTAVDTTTALQNAVASRSDTATAADVVSAFLVGAIPPVTIDKALVTRAHWVTFAGGTKVVTFAGGTKVAIFPGSSKRVVFAGGTKRVVFAGGTKTVTF